jgi:hypothetical protein
MFKTKDELHRMALSKSEDSSKINTSMTVVRLGFVTQLLNEMQENFRKFLEQKELETENTQIIKGSLNEYEKYPLYPLLQKN